MFFIISHLWVFDDSTYMITFQLYTISIHTFRVEGDPPKRNRRSKRMISIHTFRVEGDSFVQFGSAVCKRISIHTFRVEGDDVYKQAFRVLLISIHTFRVEGDAGKARLYLHLSEISIHTFRVEGDIKSTQIQRGTGYFNPHLPCGRWRRYNSRKICLNRFQSTPSVWKVTASLILTADELIISIHTFRVEGDL